MANARKFTIALAGIGNNSLLLPLEKALKKSFSPSQFEVMVPEFRRSDIDGMLLSLKQERAGGQYRITLPGFEELEARALVALGHHEDAHVAIVLDMNYDTELTGRGVQSHFQARALLMEAIGGRTWDATKLNVFAHISKFTMPYLGDTGSTPEQAERGYKTVFRGVIEGWKFQSRRYDGILRKMNLS